MDSREQADSREEEPEHSVEREGEREVPQGLGPQRLLGVDAMRAFALLGILSVNIWFFADPSQFTGFPTIDAESRLDQLSGFMSSVLFEGKSYVIFSFLFGLSVVLAGSAVSPIQRAVRRNLVLIVLGLLHGILLFTGDILMAYGILGFLLLALRNISNRAALVTAGIILVTATLLMLLVAGALLALAAVTGQESTGLSELALVDPTAMEMQYRESWGSYFSFQLAQYPLMLANVLIVQGVMVFAVFLIGLVVGRQRLMQRMLAPGADSDISTAKILLYGVPALFVGLGLGIFGGVVAYGSPVGAVTNPDEISSLAGRMFIMAGGLPQAMGYVLVLCVFFRSKPGRTVMRFLAPMGQMSLSNYLGQSLILAFVFSGLGFGAAGELSMTTVAVIIVIIWVLQLLVSGVWMKRYGRGPVEIPFRAIVSAQRIPLSSRPR